MRFLPRVPVLGRLVTGAGLLMIAAALGCSDDSSPVTSRRFSALSDSTFTVGSAAILEISNFAGRTSITPGSANVVVLTVERWASREQDLSAIEVTLEGTQNGLRIVATNPAQVNGASVDLDVAIPEDMRPVIQTGAGDIAYRGRAEGQSFFSVGAGSITLALPADLNAEVRLSVAAGTIRVDFPVTGSVGDHLVDGVIGTGADGRIVAEVAAGSIVVARQ